ncbi:hypothetical protein [Methanobrevibacter olleyae]|uniref:Uncharacterized protein n=1 Tax=Methanobrevibacter olleyae TaxID=294671 RepID=A0A1I4I528_METOL|nr:hypothetical protein [Methanobrevibacter olleyae]SFL49280.1 hypothetical protein SAMN02910297_01045 [Methanobrevibacter olleyae]
MASGFIIVFSHILPLIIGFFSILLIINGIMDEQKHITALGIIFFLLAAIGPFFVLPLFV